MLRVPRKRDDSGSIGPWLAKPRRRDLLQHPTLVIGHAHDPLHPFSDAEKVANELPNARLVPASSVAEWRLRPARLTRELAEFLDEVWALRAVA
jgi:pimeloyl-ACP methyl ester carboxylesterase